MTEKREPSAKEPAPASNPPPIERRHLTTCVRCGGHDGQFVSDPFTGTETHAYACLTQPAGATQRQGIQRNERLDEPESAAGGGPVV